MLYKNGEKCKYICSHIQPSNRHLWGVCIVLNTVEPGTPEKLGGQIRGCTTGGLHGLGTGLGEGFFMVSDCVSFEF